MKFFPWDWIPGRRAFRLGCTIAGVICVGSAWGCTITSHSDVADGKGSTDYFETPDIYRGAVLGAGSRFENCAPLTSVRVRFQSSLSGVKYVRTLVRNGASTPLYEFHPNSPLVYFNIDIRPDNDSLSVQMPVDNGAPLEVDVPIGRNGLADIRLTAGFYTRGGPMSSADSRFIGTVVTSLPDFPAAGEILHEMTTGIDVIQRSCALSDVSMALDDVSMNELMNPDDVAMEKRIDVSMNCPMGGVPVKLTLTDNHDAGNTGSQLSPAPGTVAQGVRIELLRNGTPVQFGARWDHGHSMPGGGSEPVAFSARYHRGAGALVPGSIVGEAVLIADYE
ncbi:fimbrial protein [Stenotrophomonas maltophilia]|uniref:fimbrial protein n=1 Tax=Stenotrophomonas maltophilia TaxID=40324 RepID=UPI0021C99211|nr:fimbrial protein [Stenotrophomonas maltophilia]